MRKLIIMIGMPGLLAAFAAHHPAHAEDQEIQITTSPAVRSHCLIENELGAWNISDTPRDVAIDRAHGGLSISCHSADGKWAGHVQVPSDARAEALLGAPEHIGRYAAALVGAPLDLHGAEGATGGAYRYPAGVVVPMQNVVMDVPAAVPVIPVVSPVQVTPAPVHRRVIHHVVHHRVPVKKAADCPPAT